MRLQARWCDLIACLRFTFTLQELEPLSRRAADFAGKSVIGTDDRAGSSCKPQCATIFL
jgi:hypothetical protein